MDDLMEIVVQGENTICEGCGENMEDGEAGFYYLGEFYHFDHLDEQIVKDHNA